MGIGLRNILVTGSNGQLGLSLKELSSQYGYICKFKSKKELDINNTRQIKNIIINEKIDIIINCAAYTDVKNAERDRKKANIINNLAVEKLVKQCCKHETQLIHISTDYVFDGNQQHPYTETSSTNPLNYYGLTKLKGENKILNSKLYKSIIIRTSWLYSISENNFVSEILKKISKSENFSVVDNEIGSPTNSLDLAKVIFETDLNLMFPNYYINSNSERLDLYTRLSKISNQLDLTNFENELIDRFGKIPIESINLLMSIKLRWLADSLSIDKIIMKKGYMICHIKNIMSTQSINSVQMFLGYSRINKNISFREKKVENVSKLILRIPNIKNIESALEVLKSIKSN